MIGQIDELLNVVTEKQASDLHLITGNPPILRINKELTPLGAEKLTRENCKTLIYQLLNDEQKATLERERELDLAHELGPSRYRVNMHFERGNVACAIRRLPKAIPSREELHLPKVIETFCKEIRGLVLVTGVTGCGKSTTQASMIDHINMTRGAHIVTVEDPIEYVHTNKKSVLEQREVGSDTLSFSRALKRVLRQDPDVLLVGEMRDLETMQTAITAAETGHLVISTLHTPDAPQSVDRMIDVFPPQQQPQIRLMVSLNLRGIICQQLIPRKDKKGVVPAVEVMVSNSAVSNIIRKATTQELYSVIEIGGKYGMQNMDSSLKELYTQGLISFEEAMLHTMNPESLEKKLKGII
jgi:twitching motility protein PilT